VWGWCVAGPPTEKLLWYQAHGMLLEYESSEHSLFPHTHIESCVRVRNELVTLMLSDHDPSPIVPALHIQVFGWFA
jgi:hypothetical protein